MTNIEDYIFFWKIKESDQGCLSNWFLAPFEEDIIKYLHTEQYMMYQKAILFEKTNFELHKLILNTKSPAKCKAIGQKIKNFDSKIWDNNKITIVTKGCYLKFSQNEKLKKYLLSTGTKLLVEASPYDKIWGIGLNKKNAIKIPKEKWPGTNYLGKCLMDVRNMLISECNS